MSQRAFLQAFDAAAAGLFDGAGIADAATYTAPGGGSPVSCTVLVDDAVQFFGDEGSGIVGHRTVVSLFVGEIAAPERGGVIAIAGDGKTYKLEQLIARDESRERWVVTHG